MRELAVVGCERPQQQPTVPPASASSTLPDGFPQSDLTARSAECIVYLALAREANATPGSHDAPIMQQSSNQWRASLQYGAGLTEQEIQQLVGSTVNILAATPMIQRDAAAAWCVENAAEPDPS
ncbi:MAG: hypothetical protein ACOYKM_07090 [Caulobacterales bacterium]